VTFDVHFVFGLRRRGKPTREATMREGCYTQIERGMRVVDREGRSIGTVHEVIYDDGSAIFIGLAVRTDRSHPCLLVPGERVERLHDGVVSVDAVAGDLQPYVTPAERHSATEKEYQPAKRA
jgi:hypothetical protein